MKERKGGEREREGRGRKNGRMARNMQAYKTKFWRRANKTCIPQYARA
jgi:hypothetical protein